MFTGKKLDEIMGEDSEYKEIKNNLRHRIANYYRKNIGRLRQYIAPLAALSIGVANWSKDFAASKVVGLPLIYENTTVSGPVWYLEAFLQELATMAALVFTAKEKKKMGIYAIAYEAGSLINYGFYNLAMKGVYAGVYGRVWNDIFYFFQIPVFLLSLRYYYGTKKENKDKLGN